MATKATSGRKCTVHEHPGPAGEPKPGTETVRVSPDTARQIYHLQDEFGLTETAVADFLVRFAVFAHDELPAASDNPGELTAGTPFSVA